MSSPVSCEHSRPGRLIIYSGPSGVGKGTILKQLLDTDPQLWLSVSVTTRQPRPGETDGVHYHFISQEAYDRLVKEDGMCPDALMIFILPPSLEVLRHRLVDRNTESPEAVERRMGAALQELEMAGRYDYQVVNDRLEDAVEEVRQILAKETGRKS